MVTVYGPRIPSPPRGLVICSLAFAGDLLLLRYGRNPGPSSMYRIGWLRPKSLTTGRSYCGNLSASAFARQPRTRSFTGRYLRGVAQIKTRARLAQIGGRAHAREVDHRAAQQLQAQDRERRRADHGLHPRPRPRPDVGERATLERRLGRGVHELRERGRDLGLEDERHARDRRERLRARARRACVRRARQTIARARACKDVEEGRDGASTQRAVTPRPRWNGIMRKRLCAMLVRKIARIVSAAVS